MIHISIGWPFVTVSSSLICRTVACYCKSPAYNSFFLFRCACMHSLDSSSHFVIACRCCCCLHAVKLCVVAVWVACYPKCNTFFQSSMCNGISIFRLVRIPRACCSFVHVSFNHHYFTISVLLLELFFFPSFVPSSIPSSFLPYFIIPSFLLPSFSLLFYYFIASFSLSIILFIFKGFFDFLIFWFFDFFYFFLFSSVWMGCVGGNVLFEFFWIRKFIWFVQFELSLSINRFTFGFVLCKFFVGLF